jgi:hypothetical protein
MNKTEIWNINIDCDIQDNIKKNESALQNADIINKFINFLSNNGVFHFDFDREYNSFLEIFLKNIILFHIQRLNLTHDEVYVNIWGEENEYNFTYLHMHFDHCDYEKIIEGTENKKPIMSCVTFFNENNTPLIITEITKEMVRENNYLNYDNNKLYIEFPQTLKHISFDGGTYMHGESYMNVQEKCNLRKKIVIAIWKKENKPKHLPTFDINLFKYYLWSTIKKNIDTINFENNIKEIMFFKKTSKEIIIKNSKIINKIFFDKLVKREKYICETLLPLIKDHRENVDSFVLDFKDQIILHKQTSNELFENGIEFWDCDINNIDNHLEKNDLFKKYYEQILDINKSDYNILEKYIYDIAMYHIKRLKLDKKRYCISYYNNNNNMSYNDESPLFSIQINLTDESSVCTNFKNDTIIQIDKLKNNMNDSISKHMKNKGIFFIKNKKHRHFIFNNSFYNIFNDDSFTINIWDENIANKYNFYSEKYENDTINNNQENKTFKRDTELFKFSQATIDKHITSIDKYEMLFLIESLKTNDKKLLSNKISEILNDNVYVFIKCNNINIKMNDMGGLFQEQLYFDTNNIEQVVSIDEESNNLYNNNYKVFIDKGE